MHKKAIYPGSFDPITYGHLDLIERASRIFPEVIVSVVNNPNKSTLFSLNERVELLDKILCSRFDNVKVASFDGLLVDFVKDHNSNMIIRGLRAVSDFEYELQLALTNRKISSGVETIFLMPKEEYTYLSSSLVREVAKYGGDVSQFVHPVVVSKLKEKFAV
ncbi:MAG: pantetheine-phosphate adenylyltransferase [bacterium]|nr:pantetheine-phosphate adenylyltransferase [bacterium]